jgi:signal transduction histidine kinase
LHILLTVFGVYCFFRFSEVLLQINKSKFIKWLTIIFSTAALVSPGWNFSMNSLKLLGYIFAVWGIPIVVYGAYLVKISIREIFIQKNRAILPFGIGAILLIGLGGWDLFELSMGNLPVSMPASGVGFLIAIIASSISLILNENEAVIGKLSSDVTHWKERHEAIAIEAAIGKTMRQVSHDIRSPLAALNMVMNHLKNIPEDKRVLIRTSVARINDIANSLLEQSKEGNSQGGIQTSESLQPELLPALVDSLVSEKRIQFNDRIDIQIIPDLINSYGAFANINATELKRTLSNLINNSVEAFSSNVGTVTVSVASDIDSHKISVQDNGKGIPIHVQEKLGQKGITHGKSGTQSGTGLGIYHAKMTVEALGGQFKIFSDEGKGTLVTLDFPRMKAPDWFVEKLILNEGQRVVICDDDISIHGIWRGRWESVTADRSLIEFINFTSGNVLVEWHGKVGHQKNTIFLMDYELLGQKRTGLDLIEELQLTNAILVSSRYEEPHIKLRCALARADSPIVT